MHFCSICGTTFPRCTLEAYAVCAHCHSYSYLSDRSAAELNAHFYNNLVTDRYRLDVVKKNIFYLFKSLDKLRRKADYAAFDRAHAFVNELLNDNSKKILEVGFGPGTTLVSLLKNGSDAYGIDISAENVRKFVEKYPEHSHRVSCSTSLEGAVDVVYSSALFEHLDEPHKFIDDVTRSLNINGYLILDNIPVRSDQEITIAPEHDISFWDGIHKTICPKKSLIELFEKKGFTFCSYGDFDYFTYRVLSAHKYLGYEMIENVRHPFMSGAQLPSLPAYFKICNKAVSIRSAALLGFIILQKQ